ncbi:putative bifunctional diguanylate cyclase/phosphodiesterase [Roseibium sp.]|uniref:putative bifunctional diguanylate cyclase/phosphodiesterase n=1 Tax=Roseibium sp. TaxID=1936156 RepID=UPI003A97AA84
MKQALDRRNVLLFISTASLVLLLSLGIFAANRLLNNWLLESNVNQAVDQITEAIATSGTIDEIHDLVARRNVALQAALSDQMRLTGNTQPAPQKQSASETSAMLRAALAGALAPSRITGIQIAGRSELNDVALLSAELEAFAASSEVPITLLRTTLRGLEATPGPYTVLDVNWRGVNNAKSFVVVPVFQAGQVDGGLVIVADHSAQISSLHLITGIGSLVIAGLCLASFLLAAFLLWMRFHDQVKTNRDIEFLAHHDPLTGLPNRAVFSARLNEALRLAQAKASNMAVMLIDVDKFKEINDTHGHGTGDIFLQVIADRLRSVYGDHLVARLAGDEFAVMIKSVSDVARLTRLAADMISATKAPCKIDGKELQMSLSIGIARASDGSWRASRLLHCADLALYRAKHSGRSTFSWYTAEMDTEAQKRKEVEHGLAKALKQDEFDVLFQPQYSLLDNKLKGYEALIRWEHPSKGTISPDVFIPIAEDSGLIEAIGDWVLFHACKEAASWDDPSLRVAVNVSAAQFKPGRTEQKVAQALKESRLAPERLEIEITESLLIANTEAVIETLNNIRAMGVSIAMDDFGTGYSSLSYLSKFPFDKIKIDRAFIKNLGKDISTDAVVTSIIGLGRSLNVMITAEGVENQEQVTLLRAAGCNLVQGYLFGRPDTVAAHEFSQSQQPENPGFPAHMTKLPPDTPLRTPSANETLSEDENQLDQALLESEPAEPVGETVPANA